MDTTRAHPFNKILNQPRISSKFRTQPDIDEGVKKLRRLILVEGIPSEDVHILDLDSPFFPLTVPFRILHCDREFGSFCCGSMTCQQMRFYATLQEVLVLCETRSETTPSGMQLDPLVGFSSCSDRPNRTLATDKGFKERVREDMLVRLLDAFVWRSQGVPLLDCVPFPLLT